MEERELGDMVAPQWTDEGFGDGGPLEGGNPDPDGGLTNHSFTRFYIGLGMYVTSIIFGTWKTSWGVEISGFESLQMSFNHVEEWPWEFANQVSLNQELMGWSFLSSLVGTTNWMFWDCFSIAVLASVVLAVDMSVGWRLDMQRRVLTFFAVVIVITDLWTSYLFTGSPITVILEYPINLIEWRFWEICAFVGVALMLSICETVSEDEGAYPFSSSGEE